MHFFPGVQQIIMELVCNESDKPLAFFVACEGGGLS
jgi:hypothetical protein